ncbi:MAG: hypothetical protein AVDCRST_MAG53-1364, partial [uncultured Solirubrobacteraceae bacterium]
APARADGARRDRRLGRALRRVGPRGAGARRRRGARSHPPRRGDARHGRFRHACGAPVEAHHRPDPRDSRDRQGQAGRSGARRVARRGRHDREAVRGGGSRPPGRHDPRLGTQRRLRRM